MQARACMALHIGQSVLHLFLSLHILSFSTLHLTHIHTHTHTCTCTCARTPPEAWWRGWTADGRALPLCRWWMEDDVISGLTGTRACVHKGSASLWGRRAGACFWFFGIAMTSLKWEKLDLCPAIYCLTPRSSLERRNNTLVESSKRQNRYASESWDCLFSRSFFQRINTDLFVATGHLRVRVTVFQAIRIAFKVAFYLSMNDYEEELCF